LGLDGGLNIYEYANLSPLKFIDPHGKIAGAVGRAAARIAIMYCTLHPKRCQQILKCFMNPKKCKRKFCKLGNSIYHPTCDFKICQLGESCIATKAKLDLAQACLFARTAMKRFCFGNKPDEGHDNEIDIARNKVRVCRGLLPRNCQGCD
jgi:hypothetical protein